MPQVMLLSCMWLDEQYARRNSKCIGTTSEMGDETFFYSVVISFEK